MKLGKQVISVLVLIALLLLAACGDTGETEGEERGTERDLASALRKVLPDLERFELVEFDDREAVGQLNELAERGVAEFVREPLQLELPVIDDNGKVSAYPFIAYPHNVYADPEEPGRFEIPVVAFGNEKEEELIDVINTPSLTFQGMPNFESYEELLKFGEVTGKEELADESRFQASVINVIGDQGLEASYYGPELKNPSVLESLASVLGTHFEPREARRLAAMTNANYILYSQANFQPKVEHGEREPDEDSKDHDHGEHDHGEHDHGEHDHGEHSHGDGGLQPQDHRLENGWRTFNVVMVADDSVYDPDTNTWLVSNWFARTAAAANRANFYWTWAQWGPNIPSSLSSLPSGVANNGIVMKTRLREYRVLTPFGKSILDDPGSLCGGGGSYLNEVRQLSHNTERFHNEGWMWWTKKYGGGCAYISTIHRAPRDYAVGVSGYGNATTDWVSFVFMHEFGHNIGGTHNTNAPGSPETFDSHRCRFLGFIPFGPTGPSLMSYAGGTRTYCFATTPSSGSPKKNATKVAEFLHTRLDP